MLTRNISSTNSQKVAQNLAKLLARVILISMNRNQYDEPYNQY